MLKFTSADDLSRLSKTDPAHPIIADLVQRLITDTIGTEFEYSESNNGFIALVEPEDVDRKLTDIWSDTDYTLSTLPWEGITRVGDVFLAIVLCNNDWGVCFCIPDEDWVSGPLRKCIEENLDPPLEEIQQSLL